MVVRGERSSSGVVSHFGLLLLVMCHGCSISFGSSSASEMARACVVEEVDPVVERVSRVL